MLHAYVAWGAWHTHAPRIVATMPNPLTCGYFGFVPGINKAYDFRSLYIPNTLAEGMTRFGQRERERERGITMPISLSFNEISMQL